MSVEHLFGMKVMSFLDIERESPFCIGEVDQRKSESTGMFG
jgi:hypothetical protein